MEKQTAHKRRYKAWGKKSLSMLYVLGFLIISFNLACAETINLEIGDAKSLTFETSVSEIFISNPEIADVQLSSPHQAYLFGKNPGVTKFFVMNNKGKELLKATVIVSHNISHLKELISPYDPYDLVEIRSVPGAIVLEGQAESPKIAQEIVSLITQAFGKQAAKGKETGAEAGGATIINRLVVKSPVQVHLGVKVAEVSRKVINALGINWQTALANAGSFNLGTLTGIAPFTSLNGTSTDISLSKTANVLNMVPTTVDSISNDGIGLNLTTKKLNLNALINALEQDSLLTVLAEPNLVAISGETASFLAGGEFPYPVPQALGVTTIDFKSYGVSLAFTPTVLDGGLISMKVRPEVSELDNSTAIQVNGVAVPGLLIRRAETTIELGSGQTFAIAGLLQNIDASQIRSLPGLGDLPILGPLFRSNQFARQETELVILVTPYLVEPVSGKEMMLPTDGLTPASFVEQIFERRLIKEKSRKGESPVFGAGGVRLVGPAGFSIE